MPKGDADNLRADLDDGFARVSNLLLEALCLADVTLGAVKTVLFVMRRTYGWARGRDHVYKTDMITAQEIADGTGLKLQTVRDALRSLRHKRVLVQTPGLPGGPCSYGVNPEIGEWGAGDAAWDGFRARFKDARDGGAYGRNGTLSDGQHPVATPTVPLLSEPHPPCGVGNTPPVEPPTGVPAVSPYVPSPDDTPTESLQRTSTENTHTTPLPPVAAPLDTSPNGGGGGTAPVDLDGPATGTKPRRLSLLRDDGRPHDAGAILCNNGPLCDAVSAATSEKTWSQAQRKALVLALHQAIEDDATPVTEADVMAWLGSADSRPMLTDRTLPDKYIRRMIGKREHARIEAEKAGQATRRAPPPQALDTLPSDARRSVHDILEAEKRRIAEEDRQARMRRAAQGPAAEVTAGDAS